MSTTTPEPDPQPVQPSAPVTDPDVDHDAPDHDGDRADR